MTATTARRRIVVTAGLSGGHVLPALSVALSLSELGHDVLFAGARRELEETMCERYGVAFAGLGYLRRGRRVARWRSLGTSARQAAWTLEHFRPHAVFSKGSQVSFPVVLAAWRRRIPVVVHESDALPGSENRLAARLSQTVCVGYAEAERWLPGRTVVTGNMTRPRFANGSAARCRERFSLAPGRELIFVTGGSQGALMLNRLLAPIVPVLETHWSIIHQCGRGKLPLTARTEHYVPVEFLGDEIADVYAASALLIGRAGASTITESAAYRVPAIFVPYPWGDGHQVLNARLSARGGTCRVLLQPGLSPLRLLAEIEATAGSLAALRAAYPETAPDDAVARVTALVLAAAGA